MGNWDFRNTSDELSKKMEEAVDQAFHPVDTRSAIREQMMQCWYQGYVFGREEIIKLACAVVNRDTANNG